MYLENKHIEVLTAFLDAFDLYGSGWPRIEQAMQEEFGIDNPEDELAKAREALSQC